MAYSSSWLPYIKTTRGMLYALLFLSSLGLIVSSVKFGFVEVRSGPAFAHSSYISLIPDMFADPQLSSLLLSRYQGSVP